MTKTLIDIAIRTIIAFTLSLLTIGLIQHIAN